MSNTTPFVHLHLHTDYSLLDGCQKCGDIAAKCEEFGMTAAACTDHGNMSACMEFTDKMKKHGLKPIYGCEFYIAPGSYKDKNPNVPHHTGYHLVCLAETYEGYINMCRLNEEAWINGYYYKPRVDKDLLRKYHKGIIALSACLAGEVAVKCLNSNDDAAIDAVINEYVEIFGRDNYFLEIQDHGLPEDKIVNEKVIAAARRNNIPLVATNDAHYLLKEHAEAQEVFLCIGTQATMQEKHFKFPGGPEYYLKSPEEMAELFAYVPEAISNTVLIADRCNVTIPTKDNDPTVNHYPVFDPPADFNGTREDYLRHICNEGMMERYGIDVHKESFTEDEQKKIDRMNYEIGIIEKTKFVSYFLVVWDFLHYARVAGVPLGPGRGSGAGSIVAYLMHITDLDPLKYNLLFERFLNPERVSPPDFDIDLCERRRHLVIEYVHRRYGDGNVVQIGTFGTLKARAVVKDVARALGRSFSDGNRFAKLIEADPKMTLKKAYEGSEELRNFIASESWAQEVWKFAQILEGMNRNMSMHAAGVIICDTRVSNVCPISKGANDEPTTQFPAVPDENLGLLKMDFLGLRNLTIIQDALDLIKKNTGIELTSSTIPDDDPKTFDLLNSGKTVAVFQLESPGMQKLCRDYGIKRLEDIIALIALYRPGPLQFKDEFLGRRHGKIATIYETPEMEPILKETCGIMLYQEQVMQVAQAVAGFSLGQADILRRAMGKKKKEVMESQFKNFQEGARKRGHSDAVIQQVWDNIFKFAGYGFNKSHSAAYGLLAYRTAYLKANFPAEFMAAVMTSELGNSDKLAFFLRECRQMGIKILPPDVNICDAPFAVDGPNIRFGLAAIKGVGSAVVSNIVAAREKDGPFKDINDFCERVEGNSRRLMENLIKAGAMDCFGLHRSQMLAMVDDAITAAQATIKDKKSGQMSLFDMMGPEETFSAKVTAPDLPEWPLHELLNYEKELMGFYVSGHPISQYEKDVERFQSHDLSQIAGLYHNDTVRVGAYITSVTRKVTRKEGMEDRNWVILNLESRETQIECLMFSEAYEKAIDKNPAIFQPETVVFIDGEINNESRKRTKPGEVVMEEPQDDSQNEIKEAPKIFGREIYTIDEMPARFTTEVQVKLFEDKITDEQLNSLRELCEANEGEVPVIFFVHTNDGNVAILRKNSGAGVAFSKELFRDIENIVGSDNVFACVDKHPTPRPQRNFQRNFRHKAD